MIQSNGNEVRFDDFHRGYFDINHYTSMNYRLQVVAAFIIEGKNNLNISDFICNSVVAAFVIEGKNNHIMCNREYTTVVTAFVIEGKNNFFVF